MAEKGRLVEDVLKKVLEVIPSNEIELIKELNLYYRSLDNKAPEIRRAAEGWIPFINILNYFIPNKVEDWHITIKDILENKEDKATQHEIFVS
jgi:hypothetical protein